MVLIIRGLPGSGKTTYVKRHFPGALLLEGDQYFTDHHGVYSFGNGKMRSDDFVANMLGHALDYGIPFVVITCTSPDTRNAQRYADIAARYNHKVVKGWIDYNCGDCSQNVHGLPDKVIADMKLKWKPWAGEILIRRDSPNIFNLIPKTRNSSWATLKRSVSSWWEDVKLRWQAYMYRY